MNKWVYLLEKIHQKRMADAPKIISQNFLTMCLSEIDLLYQMFIASANRS